MRIAFRTRKIRELCEVQLAAEKKFGIGVAARLKCRLADLDAAVCLKDLIAGNPHEVNNGVIQVSISNGICIRFCSAHNKRLTKSSKKLDWLKVKRVKITHIGECDE